MIRRLPVLLGALALAACGSSPATHYHALEATPAALPSGGAQRLVEILPVLVPAAVDRTEVVLTDAAGHLDVKSGERWAGALPEQLRGVIAEALWRDARAADVYAAPLPGAAAKLPEYRLAVRFERFEAGPAIASVAATWTLRRLPDGHAIACRSAAERSVEGIGATAAADALGAASRALADDLAHALAGFDAGGGCPVS